MNIFTHPLQSCLYCQAFWYPSSIFEDFLFNSWSLPISRKKNLFGEGVSVGLFHLFTKVKGFEAEDALSMTDGGRRHEALKADIDKDCSNPHAPVNQILLLMAPLSKFDKM